MSIELVTGHAGEAHVTAKQAAGLNAGILGFDDYVLDIRDKLSLTVVSANKVTVHPGELVMQGYHASLDMPEDLIITNGSQGMKRNDIITCRYTKGAGNIESASLEVVKGTPSTDTATDPAINTTSIWDGATTYDMPLYRIPLDGITIGTPVPLFNLLRPMADVWDSLTQFGKAKVNPGLSGIFREQDPLRYLKVGKLLVLSGSVQLAGSWNPSANDIVLVDLPSPLEGFQACPAVSLNYRDVRMVGHSGDSTLHFQGSGQISDWGIGTIIYVSSTWLLKS